MKHKWYLREKAVALRQRGWSYPMITKKLGVPKATLSCWFKGLIPSKYASDKIKKRRQKNVMAMQKKARAIHRIKWEKRINNIYASADESVGRITPRTYLYDVMLSMLHLCEGSKRIDLVEFANSNTEIVRLYIFLLQKVFKVRRSDMKVYLHLRSDQDTNRENEYWAKITHIPIQNFKKSQFDKRTLGKKTRIGYHGVCTIQIIDTAKGRWIQDYSRLLIQRFKPFFG